MLFWSFVAVIVVSVLNGWHNDFEEGGSLLFWLLIFWFGLFLYQYNTDNEWIAERHAEEQTKREQKIRDETPHVIREADGCKVYTFKSGERWHYFTRCPNEKVTTDTTYEQCTGSGKSRSCKPVHESIVTN